jgi:hypothetical protein
MFGASLGRGAWIFLPPSFDFSQILSDFPENFFEETQCG